MKPDRVITLPVYRTVISPIARKEWKCDLCKQPIKVGERYAHYFNRKPHEIISQRFHSDCFAMVMAYCAEKKRGTFSPRSVVTWIVNKFCVPCGQANCNVGNCDKLKAFAKFFKKELDIHTKV